MKQLLAILFTVLTIGASAQPDTTDTKPSTEDIVNSFLTELLEFSKDAGAFAKEQVPLVLQEYVYWGVAKGLLGAIFFTLFAYGLFRLAKRAVARAKEIDARKDWSDSTGPWLVTVLSSLAIIPVLFKMFGHLQSALQALIAPRVYLIETLSDLIQ